MGSYPKQIAPAYNQRDYTIISQPLTFLAIRENNFELMPQVNRAHEAKGHSEVKAALGGTVLDVGRMK